LRSRSASETRNGANLVGRLRPPSRIANLSAAPGRQPVRALPHRRHGAKRVSVAPLSWNRVPRVTPSQVLDAVSRFAPFPSLPGNERLIAYGAGRSYGDVCLNPGGALLRTRRLDHFIAFDRAAGRITCEAGVLLGDLLAFLAPRGWFLPVTPGTRFVTVGGAVANDVHGKNHHDAGSFGHHVLQLELLRSDGERIVCGPDLRREWFQATVGGLGLTGLITWVELKLAPIANPFMIVEARRFRSLEEFWTVNAEAERDFPYAAAWIDGLAQFGRGVLLAARHAPPRDNLPSWRERTRGFPFDPPISLINPLSSRVFNALYYHRPRPRGPAVMHHIPYLYPLDGVKNWNRVYGQRGFLQYQCVLPPEAARAGIADMLKIIARDGSGSFLTVLKTFGARPSVGLLSFPRPGATLALDFPNQGERTENLLRELDAVTRAARGALYPAKDARMSGEMFRAGFPGLDRFAAYIDPKISSGFWRRVTEI
jgi:FAD/FMN-containing dehydrogenase